VSAPKEIDILGIYIAPFVAYMLVAAAIFLALQPVLNRLPVDRWVWNRPLAELALLVIVTALVVFVAIGP
jgi:protein AaeX